MTDNEDKLVTHQITVCPLPTHMNSSPTTVFCPPAPSGFSITKRKRAFNKQTQKRLKPSASFSMSSSAVYDFCTVSAPPPRATAANLPKGALSKQLYSFTHGATSRYVDVLLLERYSYCGSSPATCEVTFSHNSPFTAGSIYKTLLPPGPSECSVRFHEPILVAFAEGALLLPGTLKLTRLFSRSPPLLHFQPLPQ